MLEITGLWSGKTIFKKKPFYSMGGIGIRLLNMVFGIQVNITLISTPILSKTAEVVQTRCFHVTCFGHF